jgi:hypothetical protein
MMIREFTHKKTHFTLRNEIFNIFENECLLISAWMMDDGQWFANNGVIYQDFKHFWIECYGWIAKFAEHFWGNESTEILEIIDVLFGGEIK